MNPRKAGELRLFRISSPEENRAEMRNLCVYVDVVQMLPAIRLNLEKNPSKQRRAAMQIFKQTPWGYILPPSIPGSPHSMTYSSPGS